MSLERMNMKDFIALEEYDKEHKRTTKEKEEQRIFKKRIRIFLRIFLLLIVLLTISSLIRHFVLSTNSGQSDGEIISISHQAFGIPMDGGVNTYIIEYRFDSPEREIIGVQEISSPDLKDYFEYPPEVGDQIKVNYSKTDPTINAIVELE